jgi:hypothetical protein
MKTAISIPDQVFREADALASRLGLSRSELYVRAIGALLATHRGDVVTARLNAVHAAGGNDLGIDAALAAAQFKAAGREKW